MVSRCGVPEPVVIAWTRFRIFGTQGLGMWPRNLQTQITFLSHPDLPPMTFELLATFIFASFLLAVTPGPTVSLVIANVTRNGLRASLMTIAGSLTGLSILLIIVIFALVLVAIRYRNAASIS